MEQRPEPLLAANSRESAAVPATEPATGKIDGKITHKITSNAHASDAKNAINERKDVISFLWLKAVRDEIGGLGTYSDKDLIDSMPTLIDKLAENILADQSTSRHPAIADISRLHGLQRAEMEGYLLGHLIREYHILRRIVIQQVDMISPLLAEEIIGIDDFLETAMYHGARSFSGAIQGRLLATQERLSAALSAAESQKTRYDLALLATGDVVWDWDFKTGEVRCNNAIETTFGHSLATVGTDPEWWLSQIHPDDSARVKRGLTGFLEGREAVWTDEYRFRKGNQFYADVSNRAYLLRGESLQPNRLIGAMQDITGRKAAQINLEQSNLELENQVSTRAAFLQAILDNLEEGIVGCDPKGRFNMANRASRSFFGTGVKELEQWPHYPNYSHYYDIYSSDGVTKISAENFPLQRAFRGEKVSGVEIVVKKKGGATKTLLCSGEALFDKARNCLGAVLVLHDKTKEKELAKTNVELDSFAAVAAHDLKSPLNSITQFTELLADEYHGQLGQEVDEYLDFIKKAGERMRRLIDSLLQYARAGAELKIRSGADMNEVCKMALMNLNAAIEASRANIHFDNLPIVPADEDRMSQVFQNLIANAIKYCKPGRVPELAIKAVEKEREFMFCFTDKGIGIERATANSAFDFFKRLTNSKKQEGSGVGLAVCKRIVEGHGGKIWIDSEPGVGTTVNFSLPKQAVSVGSSA